MLSADTILQGRYRIVRQLGQGGMGAVYEAVDERLDTVVALKETLFSDEKLRKQFEREARLLARLHHPALPRVSDHFNEGDGQFLVMQYIQGEDLFEMQAHRQSPFPPEDVVLWGDQLCDALDYLHTQDPQIIHRDIKPQNLKFTDRGQIVLLDFGLAKGSAGTMSVVTTSASIFGFTPNYAPLEQVQGLGTDPRSDIYSLAATLYHLATSVKPPDALSRASAIVNGLPDPLVPANAVAAGVPAAVAAVFDRGMSQKRDERYPTALAMRDALRAAADLPAGDAATVLIAGATSGRVNTVSPEPQTKLVANKTQAFGNEARTLLATDAANARGQVTSSETVTIVRPAATPKKSRMWLGAALLLLLVAVGAGGFYAYKARQGAAVQIVTVAPETSAPTPADTSTTGSVAAKPEETAAKPGDTKTEKAKQETAQRSASKTTAKSAETIKPAIETPPLDPNPSHNPDRNSDRGRDRVVPPDPPGFDQLRNKPDRQPGHAPGANQIPAVRQFPNGTNVVTQPDGTRVVTLPNGQVRIIPPPGKRNQPRGRRP